MKETEYLKKIAKLESINDQLQAEFNHLNLLLKKVGFDEGIKSLKEAAHEILDHQKDDKIE
jgi:hypothetical protein